MSKLIACYVIGENDFDDPMLYGVFTSFPNVKSVMKKCLLGCPADLVDRTQCFPDFMTSTIYTDNPEKNNPYTERFWQFDDKFEKVIELTQRNHRWFDETGITM